MSAAETVDWLAARGVAVESIVALPGDLSPRRYLRARRASGDNDGAEGGAPDIDLEAGHTVGHDERLRRTSAAKVGLGHDGRAARPAAGVAHLFNRLAQATGLPELFEAARS